MCGKNPSPQNEDNLNTCIKENSIELGQCILDCNENKSCEEACVEQFKSDHDNCPCQVEILFRFVQRKIMFYEHLVKNVFRLTVNWAAHVMDMNVSQRRSPFLSSIVIVQIKQFLSNIMVRIELR